MAKYQTVLFLIAILIVSLFSFSNSLKLRVKLTYFYNSGSNFSIKVDKSSATLNGTLKNGSGADVSASFNLNANIGNMDGKLIWGSGGFAASCDNCSLNLPSMTCMCYNSSGNLISSKIDLSRLSNSNGSFKLETSSQQGYEISSSNYDFLDYAFNSLVDAYAPNVGNLINAAQGKLLESGLNSLQGDAKRGFKPFSKGKELKIGSLVGNVMSAIDLLSLTIDYFYGTAVKGGNFKIKNSSSQNIELESTSDYQMDKWKGYFPNTVSPGNEINAYVEASNCAFKTCSDTEAHAQYKINCNGRSVRFRLRVIGGRDNFHVYWNSGDEYNECFDIVVSSEWRLKRGGAIQSIKGAMAIGNFATPWNGNQASWNPYMRVEVIPHQIGTRFPVLYEHCNFGGSFLPLGKDDATGVGYIGDIWNDRVSSIRVPPGYKVILFSEANFRGTKNIYTSDVKCFSKEFNDKISSYIIIVDDNQK
jgi:hypothetical protein